MTLRELIEKLQAIEASINYSHEYDGVGDVYFYAHVGNAMIELEIDEDNEGIQFDEVVECGCTMAAAINLRIKKHEELLISDLPSSSSINEGDVLIAPTSLNPNAINLHK